MIIDELNYMINNTKPIYSMNCDDKSLLDTNKNTIDRIVRDSINTNQVKEIEVIESSVTTKGKLIYQQLLCKNKYGIELRMGLIRPKISGKYPLIINCPGKNMNFKEFCQVNESKNSNKNIAEILALEENVVMTVDYGIKHEIISEAFNGRDETDILTVASYLLNKSPLQLIVEDILSCLEWVKKQIWVNDKIGVFGRSLGGFIAAYLALLENNITCVALTNCLCSYKTIFTKTFQGTGISYLPGAIEYFDFSDIISCLVPRQLHIQYSKNDTVYDVVEAEEIALKVANIFNRYECISNLETNLTNTGHATNIELVKDFFIQKFKF